MGKNTLSKFVKTKCNKAGKERRKINHSARKTTLTLLVNAVVPLVYPSFANKRSQKRPILYIINTYSFACKWTVKQMSKNPFWCRCWKLRYSNRLRTFIRIIILFLKMPAKSFMHRKKFKMMNIYTILKWPNFVKVIIKESPFSCFKERQLQETLHFHFRGINYIDQNFNCD